MTNDRFDELQDGRKLTIKRADGGLLLTIATMHRMETVPLTEERTGDLARWLGGDEAQVERDEWKALAHSTEVTLKQQQGASIDQLEEANRTGQAMGEQQATGWAADFVVGTAEQLALHLADDPGQAFAMVEVFGQLAKALRDGAHRPTEVEPVAAQLQRLRAMPDGHVGAPALPEGARGAIEHAVQVLRHGGHVLRQATGPRPQKALQLEHAGDRLVAVLSIEGTPFDALVAKARERAPNLFHDAAELAAIGQTVEPRDTEPPRREATGDPLRRLSTSELGRVPPVDDAEVDRALRAGQKDRDAAVGKPSTWEEAEAGEDEPEDIWTDEEHWRAMSQEGRSEILYQVKKECTPAPEPARDAVVLDEDGNPPGGWPDGIGAPTPAEVMEHGVIVDGKLQMPSRPQDPTDIKERIREADAKLARALGNRGTPGSTEDFCEHGDHRHPCPEHGGSTEPADYSTKPEHIREVERVFDASGERLVRIAKEAAALWLTGQAGCSSTELRVPVPEGSTEL